MENKDLTIILVHGAWGDGSHWKSVIPNLVNAGYKVRAVQNPLTSLADDVQKTKDLIEAQDGKVLLVGHSYGGAVITAAGNHDKVVGLVYVAAFAPDHGESLGSLLAKRATSGGESIAPDNKGFLWIKYDEFQQAFCPDLNDNDALVMSLSQKAINGQCFGDEMESPSWKNLPVWYQVSNQDKMIHPDTQREMSARMNPKKVIELDASHASMATHPEEIAELIKEAASSL
ncbi:Pyrethroid hydrolase [Chryseobacterium sp. MOF25P]|uniref:alpha/beta hydrolase n=1 Tax=unclassified Chryseobacterium TaxID=2593645 RepID=UPI0008054110|nr:MULTISPECIES: alpha/beta hydrolase [unclassified Chryseobacterium]OBW41892.1 Pyrethroid hydrolase [Chryseobacterium sp. MOF25P]OBW45101.1 Pyrethroid hydrolase [Chryseobacterium sp. BGARF1]